MTTEQLLIQQSMERMGVAEYLKTYPPKTNKHKVIVYEIALKLKDRYAAELKDRINRLLDENDELKDGIVR